MFFLTKMGQSNWETWTSRKSYLKDSWLLRLGPPTMRLPRCGETSRMMRKAMSGLWGACCMKCVLWSLPFWGRIWRGCLKRFAWDFMNQYLKDIRAICITWSLDFLKSDHLIGRPVPRYCKWGKSKKEYFNIKRKEREACWAQLQSQRILRILKFGFQVQTMIQRCLNRW